MSNQLQQPFIDIIGNRSPVQQTIKLCWQLVKDKPETIGGTIESKSAAALILTHLLGLMESAGMVNCRGWHSSAITLLRARHGRMVILLISMKVWLATEK